MLSRAGGAARSHVDNIEGGGQAHTQRVANRAGRGAVATPAFVKNPKFIGGTIVVLWVAYVVYWNHRLDPIDIQLLPFLKPAQLNVSSVIVGAAIFGCAA